MERIGIVGCAGSGKSALGVELAKRLGLSFLAAKAITVPILTRDGYDHASGVQIERFLAESTRQHELMKKTIEQHHTEGGFITDRTFVDLATYAVVEMHDQDPGTLRKIYSECRKMVGVYTHLVVCPWCDVPVANNNRRTLNPWYQFLVHATGVGLLDEWKLKYVVLQTSELKDRVEEVVKVVRPG
jgi:deoxyadenosine/deoxycytidine kinase